jgi:diguanylate cyclase (GGDEF)-like protein/PAS domain S-box-containing protein
VPPTLQGITRLDGSQRWIECSATPLADEVGQPYAVVVSFRDVTEQRATLQALLDAERRQYLLLEHAAEGHLVFDRRGRVREASAAVDRFWPVDSIIGAPARRLVHPADRKSMQRLFALVAGGMQPIVRSELRIVDAHGDGHWVEVTLSDRLDEPAIGGVVVNFLDISERKLSEATRAQLSAIVESSSDAIVGISVDSRITSWNPASEQLYGHLEADVIDEPAEIVVARHHRERLGDLLAEVLRGEHVYVPAMDATRADGSRFELSLSMSPVYSSDAELVGVSLIGRDIAERRQLERERRLAEERFRLGFERGAIGMAMLEIDHTMSRVNPALCELVGVSESELLGRDINLLVHPHDQRPSGSPLPQMFSGETDNVRSELRLIRCDGATIWTLVDTAAVRGPDGAVAYLFVQLQDITDRKRSESALEMQALHDSLTGLPNRLALERRLCHALERAQLHDSRLAVYFIDVDQFKLVNDGLGHVAGDKLLVEIGMRLARGIRSEDTVARFGGDEFVVICEDVVDSTEAELFGERILAMLDEPVTVSGRGLHLTVSCGIAIVDGASSAEEALRDADAAMYHAKEKGRARVELFDEGLRRAVRQRFDTEQALRLALERDELFVAYQPILNISTGELVGVEALVRWMHPERGLLSPAEFIPTAEESGLIVPLGEHVLDLSLAQIVRWRHDLPGCEDLWVSVNLASRQLSVGDPVALCQRMLARNGAPTAALHLELTETMVMADVENSITRLAELNALGVTLAIDDFGTGYSSLSYLSRLPVGLLKVDRSLVENLGSDQGRGNSEIFRAIVLLGKGLGVEVCAEGVEEAEQLAELVAFGCELGQGYLWARPLIAPAFESWVAERRAVAAGPTAAGAGLT